MDGAKIRRAVEHPENFKPIIFCSISMIAIGILMLILGLIVILVDHIELGPPVFDSQYARYEGSSLARTTGPLFVFFGGVLIVGNIVLLGYSGRVYYKQLQNRSFP